MPVKQQCCLTIVVNQCRQMPIGVLYDILAKEEMPWPLTVRPAPVFQDLNLVFAIYIVDRRE